MTSSTPNSTPMKQIVYRGGVVTFRIPSSWLEEYSDYDGGVFYQDRQDSGTMRLKIILATSPWQVSSQSAVDLLRTISDRFDELTVRYTKEVRPDGNAVLKYKETAFEENTPLTIFYWVIANPLPPLHARIATFSYTIPSIWLNEPLVRHELDMLEAEIEAATFSAEIGVTAE